MKIFLLALAIVLVPAGALADSSAVPVIDPALCNYSSCEPTPWGLDPEGNPVLVSPEVDAGDSTANGYPSSNPCEQDGTCDDGFTDTCTDQGLSFDYATGDCAPSNAPAPEEAPAPSMETEQLVVIAPAPAPEGCR